MSETAPTYIERIQRDDLKDKALTAIVKWNGDEGDANEAIRAALLTVIAELQEARKDLSATDRTKGCVPRLIIDMSNRDFIGANTIELLYRVLNRLRPDGELHLVGMQKYPMEVAALASLDKSGHATIVSLDQWVKDQNEKQLPSRAVV
jgi:anti-anti-sigma regulatory factor